MNFKLPRLFAVLALLVLAAVPVIFVTSCSKGSINEAGRGTVPFASLTPAANCVVDSEEDVVVGSGTSALPGCADVVLEPTPGITAFGAIEVETGGTLEIRGSKSATGTPTTIKEHQICVDGGKVETYDKTATSKNKIILEFVGNRDYNPSGQPNDCEKAPENFRKGIDVLAGTLELEGAKGVPEYDANGNNIGGVSWTTLAAPAGSQVPGAKVKSLGDKTLYLSADVTKGPEGWQQGDWIVVATTDYDPFHSEFVQIAAPPEATSGGVAGAKSVVTLEQPLVYYHFGSLPPSSNAVSSSCPNPFYAPNAPTPITAQYQPAFLCDGATQNYGVDERAEVGLISRDLTLTAQTEKPPATPPASPTSSVFWGGEIKIHHGFTKVVIQGVRLSKFGKDKLGSYPIHFHQVGPIGTLPDGTKQTAIIDADSVDHSYNKCVTIHATANLTISNLVCARILGHIFYEELNSAGEENQASDSGLVFNHDLGIGAMSNSFDIYPATVYKNLQPTNTKYDRQQMINKFWWAGDYMTNDECATDGTCINYDGFNIPDTDNQQQDVHGFCYNSPAINGKWSGGNYPWTGDNKACTSTQYYIEPASGFWIQNPGTVLTNDAIAGCQGDGVGYWWVPPGAALKVDGQPQAVDLRYNPLGTVKDDRSSACYHSYFAEGENNVNSTQLDPLKNGENAPAEAYETDPNIISHFEDLTATHSRWRAFWIRGTAAWYVLKDGHFADDNRGATFLTSGGVDGNGPGIWDVLEDSTFVGESQDNVGRWGPCPTEQEFGINTGLEYGCIDYAHPNPGTAHSGEVDGKGYPDMSRNSYGYQIYDGPPLIYHDRFVNYNHDSNVDTPLDCNPSSGNPDTTTCALSAELDKPDRDAMQFWQTAGNRRYEGDAAFGWFPANQNAYPTATASKQLMWNNTNFRHQIFTNLVNIGPLEDGDKNTMILDEDGTLSGFGVKLAPNSGTHPVYAASLNNLPLNSTSNAVDECLSRGSQDERKEGRDSSLMSPATMGTLEFGDLYPYKDGFPGGNVWPGWNVTRWQQITFTRTDEIPNGKGGFEHPSMSLLGRNGQGLWEPKVSNGYGYTITTAPAVSNKIDPKHNPNWAGIYSWIDVGVADVVDPNISEAHPFFIRLGIPYKSLSKTGTAQMPPPNDKWFIIKRGYKTYYGGLINTKDKFTGGQNNDLLKYFTNWTCKGLDGSDPTFPNIPYKGKTPGCPAGMDTNPAPSIVTSLSPAASLSALTKNGKPWGEPVVNKYYYDPNTGYLWLNIVQEVPNAQGPSPIGSCDSEFDGGTPDPACPWNHGESYYVCPKNGCIIYTIEVKKPVNSTSNYTYAPGPSTGRPNSNNLMPAPTQPNELTLTYPKSAPKGTVVAPTYTTDLQGVVYAQPTSTTEPACPVTQHDSGG